MEYGELLKSFLQDLQAIFRKHISLSGLTLPQILILSSIPDEGIDMSTLAVISGVDNSTMTRLIDTMVNKGWVERTSDSVDRRAKIVTLSPTGELLLENIESQIDSLGDSVAQEITEDAREDIKETLLTLHWTLSKIRLNKQ